MVGCSPCCRQEGSHPSYLSTCHGRRPAHTVSRGSRWPRPGFKGPQHLLLLSSSQRCPQVSLWLHISSDSFSGDKISLDCAPLSLWGSFLLESLSWDLLMGVYRSSQLPIFCSAALSSVVCFFLNFRICDIYLFLTLAHDILEKIITHWKLIIYTPRVIFIFYIAMKTS